MKVFTLLAGLILAAAQQPQVDPTLPPDVIITDEVDYTTTAEGGGPGGGGPGGGGPGGGGPGDEQTVPPPVDVSDETPPPPDIVPTDHVFTGTRPTPPPDDGGITGDPNGDGSQTAQTWSTEPPRTTTTTKTQHAIGDTDQTPPPVDQVLTTKLSTSYMGPYYDCEGECAKPDYAGDGFCDDKNNRCNCDWDGGDCCGTVNHYIYCTACKCRDPALTWGYNCPDGTCGDDSHYGDGYCDDYNNNCFCNWDGGDCCGTQNHYGLCDDCLCLEPLWHDGHAPECNGNCGQKNYIGDGFCDDDNNNCGCGWDSGDCCGSSNSYAHCDDCFCLDPNSTMFRNPNNETAICGTQCVSQGWFADGFCDDANNVCGCDWDGGDCCGMDSSYLYCDECMCKDPLYAEFYNCPEGECENSDWQGDAYCDDGNNNCGCNWDGGDCCGSEHFYTYCDVCECKDPANEDHIYCHGSCDVKAWKGDGYCDDDNNVCGCDWDGGDCCDVNSKMTHCTVCECIDPTFTGDPTCSTPCETTQWQGDGHCDDGNNVCGCDWDAGDCCGSLGNDQFAFCNDCRCQDPDNSGFQLPTAECAGVCQKQDWKSDTFCDDGNNNCGCDWDGGDCCGTVNKYTHCTDCKCQDPDYGGDAGGCQGSCSHSGWTGDGFCDDGNNNCGCNWDGGDCCGDDKNYNQCTECACLSGLTTQYVPGQGQNTQKHTTESAGTPAVEPPIVTPDGGGGNGGGGITAPPDVHG